MAARFPRAHTPVPELTSLLPAEDMHRGLDSRSPNSDSCLPMEGNRKIFVSYASFQASGGLYNHYHVHTRRCGGPTLKSAPEPLVGPPLPL
jgi:hypothetical protein